MRSLKLLFILLAALLINTYLFINNPNFGGDAYHYIFSVENMFNGKGFSVHGNPTSVYGPGYGLVVYIFFLLFGDYEFSAMLLSSVCYLLSIIVSFHISLYLKDEKAALLTAFFLAFSPAILSYSYIALTESFYIFLLLSSLYVSLRLTFEVDSLKRSLILGLLLGYCYLTRGEGFILSFMLIIFLFIFKYTEFKKKYSFGFLYALQCPITVMLVFTTIATTNIYTIYLRTGQWMISGMVGKMFHWISHDVGKTKNMIEFAMLYLSNFLKHFYLMIVQMFVLTIHALFPLLFLLSSAILLGLYYFLKEKHVIIKINWSDRTKKIIILFLVFIFPVLIYPISFLADERYIMQYSVFVMIACAIAIYRVQEIINDNYRRHVFIFINSTAIIAIVVLILYVYKNGSSPYQFNYFVYLAVFISLLSSQLYLICKREMKGQGILMVYLISFATITGLCRVCNDIDCYRKLFPYNKTLPEIINNQHANIGLRRAGFWIAHNVNDLSNIRIMAAGKGDVALFYAYGCKRVPETRSKQIPLGAKLESISTIMKNEKIDYLLFDKNYINRYSALKTLWNNPKLANLYGLKTLYIDSEKYFQIYKSE